MKEIKKNNQKKAWVTPEMEILSQKKTFGGLPDTNKETSSDATGRYTTATTS